MSDNDDDWTLDCPDVLALTAHAAYCSSDNEENFVNDADTPMAVDVSQQACVVIPRCLICLPNFSFVNLQVPS